MMEWRALAALNFSFPWSQFWINLSFFSMLPPQQCHLGIVTKGRFKPPGYLHCSTACLSIIRIIPIADFGPKGTLLRHFCEYLHTLQTSGIAISGLANSKNQRISDSKLTGTVSPDFVNVSDVRCVFCFTSGGCIFFYFFVIFHSKVKF